MTTIDAIGVTTIDGRDVVHDGSFAPSQSQMTELRMLCARPLRASDKQAGDSCRWARSWNRFIAAEPGWFLTAAARRA